MPVSSICQLFGFKVSEITKVKNYLLFFLKAKSYKTATTYQNIHFKNYEHYYFTDWLFILCFNWLIWTVHCTSCLCLLSRTAVLWWRKPPAVNKLRAEQLSRWVLTSRSIPKRPQVPPAAPTDTARGGKSRNRWINNRDTRSSMRVPCWWFHVTFRTVLLKLFKVATHQNNQLVHASHQPPTLQTAISCLFAEIFM